MSELNSESTQVHIDSPQGLGNAVIVAAIAAATIVTLACIAACTVTVCVFLINAPW